MSDTASGLDVGAANTASASNSRTFADIRREALSRWLSQRVYGDGEPWECRWQTASQSLPHKNCATPDCGWTHVSPYCGFNDAADHFVDLLTDERHDHIPFGIAPTFQPSSDNFSPETVALARYYVRVLWAAGVLLDDLDQLLIHTDENRWQTPKKGARTKRREHLSVGTPLEIDTLQEFINQVGKHTARKTSNGLHCLNHHVDFFFEDTDADMPLLLNGLVLLAASQTWEKNGDLDAVLLPRLGDLVVTVAVALRNLDADVNNPAVLGKLANEFGTCW